MPINKIIAIHNSPKAAMDYTFDEQKTDMSLSPSYMDRQYVKNALNYSFNEEKTIFDLDGDRDLLISGHLCSPDTADLEFSRCRKDYYSRVGGKTRNISGKKIINHDEVRKGAEPVYGDKEERLAYHLIQSFAEDDELDPRLVHQIGLELCEKAFPDYMATVSTHMNTENLHNHIVLNAFPVSGCNKYLDNKASLQRVRDISDDIALSYGIDIIIDVGREAQTISWSEHNAKSRGESWKDQVRADIDVIQMYSHSWDEFKKNMTDSGYKIRETGKYVTYTLPDSATKKIRDVRLGADYTRAAIRTRYGEITPDETKEQFVNKRSQTGQYCKRLNLYIGRYTDSGRRRSDLERLIILAIKILKQIGDIFNTGEPGKDKGYNPIYFPSAKKIALMEETLHLIRGLGIETTDDLKGLLRKSGAELSQKKRELKDVQMTGYKDMTIELINSYEVLKPVMERIGIKDKDVFPKSYTPEEIRRARAKQIPMTPKQRRDLYKAVDDSAIFRLKYKYDDISYEEAKDILGFLKGKTTVKPEALVTMEEYEAHRKESWYDKIYEKRQQELKEKYGNTKAPPQQQIEAAKLLETSTRIKVDPDRITLFDVLDIKNHYQQPMGGGTIFSQDTLAEPGAIKRLQELSEYRKQEIPVPVESLTKTEARDLYSYYLAVGKEPEIIRHNTEAEKYLLFESFLLDYSMEDAQAINEYREVLSSLAEIGISPENMQEEKQKVLKKDEEQEQLEQEVRELAKEYQNLSRLARNVSYADNRYFTRGAFFDKGDIEEVVDEKEEQPIDMEEIIPEEKEQSSFDLRKNIFFENFNPER